MVTTILALGIGLLCTNLWPDWPRPIRHLGPVMLTVALVVNLYQSWVKNEIIWGICWAAIILVGVVQFFRGLRYKEQLKGAQEWPLTKGTWGQNYKGGGNHLVYYDYQVNDGYYSGVFVAGSTLERGLSSRLDGIRGKRVLVRYRPEMPEISTIFTSDQVRSSS